MRNPGGIPSNAITEQEFLNLKGVGDSMSGYAVDKIRGNKDMTARGQKRFDREVSQANASYQARRDAARNEYRSLIESGKIRDKTPLERRITQAHGNPSLESTQAARRLVEKKGYNWKTGRKL